MGKRQTPPLKDVAADRAACRSYAALPLAQLVPKLTRAAFRARSPAGADLMTGWESIVGPRLAELTMPRKLSRGQLTIACAGPVAMELQHAAASLIERINVQVGAKLVERLRFVQTPVPRRPSAQPRRVMHAGPPITGLPPGPLNDALAALQTRVKEEVLF
jgi:hypothetical protein